MTRAFVGANIASSLYRIRDPLLNDSCLCSPSAAYSSNLYLPHVPQFL